VTAPLGDGHQLGVVVFDLDGTLTDSQAGIVASYRHTCRTFGLEPDPEAIRPWIGPPLQDGLAALGIAPDDLDAAVATYRSYFSTTGIFDNRLYDGAADLVAGLRRHGVTVALATSKLGDFAQTILDHFGLAAHFAVVAGSTRDGRRRHKVDILGHALSELGHPAPGTVSMVGDREQDVYAAIEHGVHPIGALWGYGSRRELTEAGAELLAAGPRELLTLITAAGQPTGPGPCR
jgi:phosphoglycolate phosphatase